MWPFKKRHQQFPILPFKSGEGFFRHWCDYGDNHLAADQPIVALVLDARKFAGTQTAVKTRDDGIQVAVVRIASDDGGFEVIAETAGHGDPLAPGNEYRHHRLFVAMRGTEFEPVPVKATRRMIGMLA